MNSVTCSQCLWQVLWWPGCLECTAAGRHACEDTRCGWRSCDGVWADWAGPGSTSTSSIAASALAAPGNKADVTGTSTHKGRPADAVSPLRWWSSTTRPPRSPEGWEERKRETDSPHAHTHTHWRAHVSILTWVDDSASSAKVQTLNTQLFTSTGRNTNRM